MTASDMKKALREKRNISIIALRRRICQISQNFNKKLQRDTVTFKEVLTIVYVLDVDCEHAFILSEGKKSK